MSRSSATAEIQKAVVHHGGNPASLLFLEDDSPALLPYATLYAARSNAPDEFGPIMAIYEWEDRPLIALANQDQIRDEHHLSRLRRAVAMRGDVPYFGVIDSGRLIIHQISLDNSAPEASVLPFLQKKEERRAIIPFLGSERPIERPTTMINDVVLRLLSNTIDTIISEGVSDEDAISLVGRALFVRFLADRSLLDDTSFPIACHDVSKLFDSPEDVAATVKWLDKTFNGDFLPLSKNTILKLSRKSFLSLGNVLRRAPGGQLYLGWAEKWDRLDFAHIPVGVLSQAYERYLSGHDPATQHREGGYYTPKHIAELMVRASFSALRSGGDAAKSRILDPAAGAGVFLITAFRQLVAERWHSRGIRPETMELREILDNQITGFDVNEAALRFAALGLYLISIELDPNPEPVAKLKFTNLRPKTLLKVTSATRLSTQPLVDMNNAITPKLGSLGPEIDDRHVAAYDLVIGNPPWATSTQLHGWRWLQAKVNALAQARLGDPNLSAPLPNEILDLPFVWRSLEWAKAGGQIAFALHARLLFQQGETMPEARAALFRALEITSVVNGAELRKTKVWPDIHAPFCLLFARNVVASPGAAFRFVTPRLEEHLNNAGAWRIDVTNSDTIANSEVISRPTILKTLFRGSRLDVEILDRILGNPWPSLDRYWRKQFGEFRGKPRLSGNGYQRLRNSSRKRVKGDKLAGASAKYLHGLPHLLAGSDVGLVIDTKRLGMFDIARIHGERSIDIFRGPLLLVGESPPVRNGRLKVAISPADVVYSQSFHGYSAAGHNNGQLLIRYMSLLVSSRIALWRALMTSGRFGFEREVVEKFVIDGLPVKPFESLSKTEVRKVKSLFDLVAHTPSEKSWSEVDAWVGALYGLDDRDLETIKDTLATNLPFAKNKKLAQVPPTGNVVKDFCDVLSDELSDWGPKRETSVAIFPIQQASLSPWQFIEITGNKSRAAAAKDPVELGLVQAANAVGATEMILLDGEEDRLWLGRLRQYRYWTLSQARLSARHLLWEHPEMFNGTP